nr:MAG TPA: hypothetical protein [Caudoviricetes sp.]
MFFYSNLFILSPKLTNQSLITGQLYSGDLCI